MKFTLGWLKDHLETEASVEEIAEVLTDLGLEVEGVENPGEVFGAFVIGEVVSAEKHPDADKLNVCQVNTGEISQIICGAPNARAGIKVVVARPGTYVPGIETTIQIGKIRGIESHGMMCSARELELGNDHDGIIELPADAPVGERFSDYLAKTDPGKVDPVIEIAITPNRQDALGVRGVARDLAARAIGTLKAAAPAKIEGQFESPITVAIEANALEKAPHFTGRVIRGVKNGPSPQWLQDRLKAIGLRPISTLVDITNFFTFDQNRPLHVFDADKVKGNLKVHFAQGGETLTGLDDKDYEFEAGMLAISDDEGVESIAGIMGGAATGCTEDTVNVFLESAYWDPTITAITGRKLKINSDARYRFERGIDPEYTQQGLDDATRMILELCGGEPSHAVEAGGALNTTRSYKLNPDRVTSLVGMDIAREEQVRILTALGFSATGTGETLEVWVPSWRRDVQGEADLVEEIARVVSLTKLKGKPLTRPDGIAGAILTPMQNRQRVMRRVMASLGLNECVTYSFIDQNSAKLFGGGENASMVGNPISSDMSHMRPDLLPGLLQAAERNQARGFADLALFELGPVFAGGEPEDQSTHAASLRVGSIAPRNAHGTQRSVDIYDAKADAEAALNAAGVAVNRLMVIRNAPEWFHPARSASLCLGPKNPLAVFGELHPKVLKFYGLKGRAVAAVIYLENAPFPKSKSTTRAALILDDLQAVDRDFAFVMDASFEVAQLEKALKAADKKLVSDVTVFDVFSGKKAEEQFGEGKKSVAFTIRLQPKDKTLTDKEIDEVSKSVIAIAEKNGAKLRQ